MIYDKISWISRDTVRSGDNKILLKRITLKNYGPYADRHQFDFTTTPSKPIILIGGRNGDGKTTLFESVRLCLYGSYDFRYPRRQYKERLDKLMHRDRTERLRDSESQTSISVEFLMYMSGHIEEFMVERLWRRSKDGISEEMVVKRRGEGEDIFKDINSIGREQLQSFVNGLIPPEILDLFFFDGEEVRMAQRYDIKSPLNSLLGVDIVEQLQKDLKTTLTRSLVGDDKHLAAEFKELNKQMSEAESKIDRLYDREVEKKTDKDRILVQIQEAEAILSKMGGSFAQKRHKTQAQLDMKRNQIETHTNFISGLCASTLPFGIIPEQTSMMLEQIQTDNQIAQNRIKADIINDICQDVQTTLSASESLCHIDNQHKDNIINNTLYAIKRSLPKNGNASEVLGFSTRQQERIRNIIQDSINSIQHAQDAVSKYDSLKEEITILEESIIRAPSDDEIGPFITRIGRMRQELGRLEGEIDTIEGSKASGLALIKHITIKMRDIRASQYKNEKSRRSGQLVQTIQRALDIYAKKLRERKMALLESYITETVITLMHKQNFIKSVKIDPNTFDIALYDMDSNEIPLQTISQGERQMLFMSILWGLARTSGRPLPFMIDSPLFRLDVEHRSNLVDRFFPLASHQIILFSINTEIGQDEYSRLLPYISKSYTIQHDQTMGQTQVRTGYFWDER